MRLAFLLLGEDFSAFWGRNWGRESDLWDGASWMPAFFLMAGHSSKAGGCRMESASRCLNLVDGWGLFQSVPHW